MVHFLKTVSLDPKSSQPKGKVVSHCLTETVEKNVDNLFMFLHLSNSLMFKEEHEHITGIQHSLLLAKYHQWPTLM